MVVLQIIKDNNNSGFGRAVEMNFKRLVGNRNVIVDLKYDVLCLCKLVYSITACIGRSNGLNFVFVGGTACCNPTQKVVPHSSDE